MAKVFGGKSRSTTAEAKKVIREEIKGYFNPREYGVRSTVDAMKKDADAYNCGRRGWATEYEKGTALVDAGCLAIYYDQQKVMLGKIYGKDNVKNWDGDKIHSTYKHLIGREYNAMLTEQEQKKAERKAKAAQKKALQKEQTEKKKAARKAKATVKKASVPKPKTTAKAKTAKKKK